MEIEDSPHRVSIGFPLGLALLVALLLFICCFFCCCLHWEKLQTLLQFYGFVINDPHAHHIQTHFTTSSPKPGYPVLKQIQRNDDRSLPVLMPGDEVPTFIALACPCQPPMEERIIVHVHKGDFCS